MDADEYMHLLSWCCFLAAIVSIFLPVFSPSKRNGRIYGARPISSAYFHRRIPGTGHGDRGACHLARHQGRPTTVSRQALYVVRVRGNGVRIQVHGRFFGRLVFCGISGFDSLWRKGGAARLTGVILAVLLVPVLIVAVAAPDTFLELIGKDPTLTGRTEIWAYVTRTYG